MRIGPPKGNFYFLFFYSSSLGSNTKLPRPHLKAVNAEILKRKGISAFFEDSQRDLAKLLKVEGVNNYFVG